MKGVEILFFDDYYLMLVVPALIISLIFQLKVSSTFSRYSKVGNEKQLTGAVVAELLLRKNGIYDVRIEQVSGKMTDHYDPGHRVMRLSESVYGSATVAAVGVAAHEAGHAVQHADAYWPLGIRSTLVPLANVGSAAGPYMAMFGLMLSFDLLFNLGILLFAIAVLFYLITLPVEFNASARALTMLSDEQILSEEELAGSKQVLQAAGMTYVASALVAVANLARFILLSRGRRRNGK